MKKGLWRDEAENVEILWCFLPRRWIGSPERIRNGIASELPNCCRRGFDSRAVMDGQHLEDGAWENEEGQVWISPEIRRLLRVEESRNRDSRDRREDGNLKGDSRDRREDITQAWLHRLWKEQPPCSQLVMILPGNGQTGDAWTGFLEENRYRDLNGLYLVVRDGGEWNAFLERLEQLYEETGLVAVCVTAGSEPERQMWEKIAERIFRRREENPFSERRRRFRNSSDFRDKRQEASLRVLCLDFCRDYEIPYRSLPEGMIYVDMTSDSGKERLFLAKRKDISYISARNWLDTYVRKRYNTFRCEKE